MVVSHGLSSIIRAVVLIAMSSWWSLLLIAGLSALGWWLAEVNRIGKNLGATMVILLLGFLVANLSQWQPATSAVRWINGPLTSIAIAELLLAVELRRVLPDARRLLPPFITTVLATLSAVLLGGWLLSPWLGSDLFPLAGLFSATFTGGSLNFVSIARSLQPPASLLLIATAADQIAFTAWFVVSLVIGRARKQRPLTTAPVSIAEGMSGSSRPGELIISLLWGLGVLLITELLSGLLQLLGADPPSILVLTTVALITAQLPGAASRRGCYGLGLILIQPFFAVIGLSSPLAAVLGEGLPVLVYATLVVTVQAVVVLAMQRRRGWPLEDSLVASQAAVGGPSTALALAGSLGRNQLVLPAVAIGLLGYLLGTYLGLAATAVVHTVAG